jgi:hypothetical protein
MPLRKARAKETSEDVVDLVFEWLVRDFSTLALDLHGKASSTPEQQAWVLAHLRKPVIDRERDARILRAGARAGRRVRHAVTAMAVAFC